VEPKLADNKDKGVDSRGRSRRILITGGGTGGHVYPGLAVAEALLKLDPGLEIRFAGTRHGLESVLVPRAGYRFHRVPASGVRGLGHVARVRFVVNFVVGTLRSLGLMLTWRPAVVLGTGGYVSAPVMAAARLLGVPCAIQEQNAVPGSANRLVGRWARRVYLGFSGAAEFFRSGAAVETGNPVRASFADAASAPGDRPESETRDLCKRVLIFGGSRGARTLNRAAGEAAEEWRDRADLALRIQTGPADHAALVTAFGTAAEGRVHIVPYIEDMAEALHWADLVVCRAGAMTLAELQVAGRPALLVPFPHATDDHQLRNAEGLADLGAARVLEDNVCDGKTLVALVDDLLADGEALAGMAAAARTAGRPRAALVIAADLLQLAGHPAGRPARTEQKKAAPSVS